eukprot:3044286-Pyramimonas_sp.AAC.1
MPSAALPASKLPCALSTGLIGHCYPRALSLRPTRLRNLSNHRDVGGRHAAGDPLCHAARLPQ